MKFLRYLNIVTILWITFLILQFSLSGNWWVWNYVSFLPPIAFLVITLGLAGTYIFGMVAKVFELDAALLYILPILFLLIIPVYGISDINLEALHSKSDKASDITVFNWNSRFWNDKESESELITFLKNQNADVYIIQEFMTRAGEEISINSVSEAFEEYEINTTGELLTLSRFPITQTFNNNQDEFLRTDILVDDERVSIYNVHIPVHIFRNGERMQYLHRWRVEEMDKLVQEISKNENPLIIGGDFNTTSAMGLLSDLNPLISDSVYASNHLFPATWDLFGLRLWRIDYVFTDADLKAEAVKYSTIDPLNYSDHTGILVDISISNAK